MGGPIYFYIEHNPQCKPNAISNKSSYQTWTQTFIKAPRYKFVHCGNVPQIPYRTPANKPHAKVGEDQKPNSRGFKSQTLLYKYWKLVSSKEHQLHRLLQYLKNINFSRD